MSGPEPEHVLLETNFVVDWAAPTHQRRLDAIRLVERAEAGELQLWIPSISLMEARKVLGEKRFQLRDHVKPIRLFLREIRARGEISKEEAKASYDLLHRYEQSAHRERGQVDARLGSLHKHEGVHVFALDEKMLGRSIDLARYLRLDPFDLSILAAVLVMSERFRRSGVARVSFCELDGDLQPWARDRSTKQPLARFYDEAGVWVYEDYLLQEPPRPTDWPSSEPP